jgi:5,5'-dehydrodivanillate O-demethylase
MDRSQERLGESDRGLVMLRRLCMDQIDVVEAGGDPINTFRDPATNQRVDLPIPNYFNPAAYMKGSLVAVTTGTNCPWLDEVDEMMDKAAQAARAERESVGTR